MDDKSLHELQNNIFSDGVIDAAEVSLLEASMYSTGSVSLESASILFEINDAITGNPNAPGWEEFFIRAVSDAVLADSDVIGGLSTSGIEFLVEHIMADDEVDQAENALLLHIRNNTTFTTPEFDDKLISMGVLTETDVI